ncbi:MAG: hypothetical protein CMJ31_00680 [Phycisphaerae bacterium]|nr:hypothetical protein [Phycisphaerae bacterium]
MRTTTMIVALAGFAAAASAQNLLTNGDLEIGADGNTADGWTLTEPDMDVSGGAVNSAEFVGFANNTMGGARGLWFRSFEGGLGDDEPFMVNAILTQDVAGVEGVEYTLSAFSFIEANFTADALLLGIDFLDMGGNVLNSVELDLTTVNMADATWRQFSVSGIGDAGTVGIRARAELVNGVLADANPQSAFVDDFVLVPAPSALALLGLGGLTATRRRR